MMRIRFNLFAVSLLTLALFAFDQKHFAQQEWTKLFNGKDLSGWDTYIGPSFDNLGKKINDIPTGLNKDPLHVFSVVNDQGEKVLRISGQQFGGISTTNEYENYHLKLLFRWGKQRWPPKTDKPRDSGVLYHCVGPMGADFGFWMRSQEFQVEEGNCGDYWGVAGGTEMIPAIKKSDSEYVYTPGAEMLSFAEGSATGRHCIKRGNPEKLSGEWNTLELYTHGDTSVHVINGNTVMVLYHSQQQDHGAKTALAKGKIQIQSEGAEIFYRQIAIAPLTMIPPALLR